jgi:hypothetical protein
MPRATGESVRIWASLVALVLVAGNATAEVVSYAFSATVRVTTTDRVAIGDPASVVLTYDTETPDGSTADPDHGRYESPNSELILEFGAFRFRCESVLLQVENDVYVDTEFLGDSLSAGSGHGHCDSETFSFFIYFHNEAGTAFETDELPRLETVEFDRGDLYWNGSDYPGDLWELGSYIAADLTPLTVPEPASGVFVALLALAALRRRHVAAAGAEDFAG